MTIVLILAILLFIFSCIELIFAFITLIQGHDTMSTLHVIIAAMCCIVSLSFAFVHGNMIEM